MKLWLLSLAMVILNAGVSIMYFMIGETLFGILWAVAALLWATTATLQAKANL